MAGRHSIAIRRRARMLEMADVGSHLIHLLTPDTGRQTPSDYIAVRGTTVIPAPTTEPRDGHRPSRRRAIPHSAGQGCAMSPHPAGTA